MARIRNIKPEFFRHEKLQELGPLNMLVFAGLWCQCDKYGNFEWKPRQLKLDILPFVDFDMGSTLEALWIAGVILKYSGDDGREYGHIPTFTKHQRIMGTEVKNGGRFPAFFAEKEQKHPKWKHQGSTKEAPRKRLGRTELGVTELRSYGNTEIPGDQLRGGDVPEHGGEGKTNARPPDPVWETVRGLFWPAGVPTSEKSRLGKVVRDLKEMHATPEQILRKFDDMQRQEWGKFAPAESLVKNWAKLSGKERVHVPSF